MLADLISSKTRAEFFRILFGIIPEEFYLREIERQSGLSIRTVQREADKLTSLQLLNRRVSGNRTYYRANISHPLYKTLRELVLKTSLLAEVLKKAFKDERVKFVFLFGSIVSGNFKPESDIDIFVVGDLGFRAVSGLLAEPTQIISREINPHVMKLEEFVQRKKDKDHFVTSVLGTPIQMIIGDEDDLKTMG